MVTNSPLPDRHVVYGFPPDELVELASHATQVSPLVPNAAALEDLGQSGVASAVILAPPGTIERRYAIAKLLQAARPGAHFTVLAPKAKGGSRLQAELEAFGCEAAFDARRHFRIAEFARPTSPAGLAEAIAAGSPFFHEATGFWTQAGIFAFDRIDPGSQMLLDHLPALKGRGADLGCGIGVLGRAALGNAGVTELVCVDTDGRAVEACRRNLPDPRVSVRWADLRQPLAQVEKLDFVLSNPPFHDGGAEDRNLGQAFIRRAADVLRKGGTAFIVANRHLPYEATLSAAFARVSTLAETGAYKIFEARR